MEPETLLAELTKPRPCTGCNGTQKASYDANAVCLRCNRVSNDGTYPGLDLLAVHDALFTSRGGTRRFRKSFSSAAGFSDRFSARVYYVWRIARFNGGADVTMPMTAELLISADPFKPELEQLAQIVARQVFGTAKAGAHRWARALGYDVPEDESLPATAQRCGPVVIGEKPDFEQAELDLGGEEFGMPGESLDEKPDFEQLEMF